MVCVRRHAVAQRLLATTVVLRSALLHCPTYTAIQQDNLDTGPATKHVTAYVDTRSHVVKFVTSPVAAGWFSGDDVAEVAFRMGTTGLIV